MARDNLIAGGWFGNRSFLVTKGLASGTAVAVLEQEPVSIWQSASRGVTWCPVSRGVVWNSADRGVNWTTVER